MRYALAAACAALALPFAPAAASPPGTYPVTGTGTVTPGLAPAPAGGVSYVMTLSSPVLGTCRVSATGLADSLASGAGAFGATCASGDLWGPCTFVCSGMVMNVACSEGSTDSAVLVLQPTSSVPVTTYAVTGTLTIGA